MRTPKMTLVLTVLVVGAAELVVGADLPFAVEAAMDRCEPMVMLRHGNMIADWDLINSGLRVVFDSNMGDPHDASICMLYESSTTYTTLAITDSFEDFRVGALASVLTSHSRCLFS